MTKQERMHRSQAARTRRKNIKEILFEKTQNFYDRMRRLKKRKKKNVK